MKIEYESLQRFARKYGDLRIFAPNGEVVILKDGTANVHSVIDKAKTFVFEGKEYTRTEFEEFLTNHSAQTD